MSMNDAIEEIRAKLRRLDETKVRLALLGQPKAGKSTLINAIVGRAVSTVGAEMDIEPEEAEHDVFGVVFKDHPGYGTKKQPVAGYVEKYNLQRFDLFVLVFESVPREPDYAMVAELNRFEKPIVLVRSKSESIQPARGPKHEESKSKIAKDIRDHVGRSDLAVFFTSITLDEDGSTARVDGVRELALHILDQLGPTKKARWALAAKARSLEFLDAKRDACMTKARLTAGLVAASALVPIPGVGVSIDLGLLLKLLNDIRSSYGLTEDVLGGLTGIGGALAPVASRLLSYVSKEGLLIALKQFAGKTAAKEFGKYIPFVGPVIAASLGYWITVTVAESFIDDCHKLAEAVLERELHPQS